MGYRSYISILLATALSGFNCHSKANPVPHTSKVTAVALPEQLVEIWKTYSAQIIREITVRPMSPEIIKAWEKAGAEYGRIRTYKFSFNFQAGPLIDNELPAFFIRKDLNLSELPAPDVPFGLMCWDITEAGMKGIAAFKRLQALKLMGRSVTDAGLKEIAGLKQLSMLNLMSTAVTDSGLKELSTLTQLQSLDLSDTKVTDSGLKEVSSFKQLSTLNLGTVLTLRCSNVFIII
jgi:hypothetical protein